MAASTDLWGNIDTQEIKRTPLSILKEQAMLLGKKTRNVIEAKVETRPYSGGWLGHKLLLVAPVLDNYTYELVEIYHPIQLYPVSPDSLVASQAKLLPDEPSFMKWLGERLSSSETHRIVTNLLSQSRS